MKRILVGVMFVIAMSVGFVGCSEKSSVTKETKVKTPGGETKTTEKTEVTKTGDEPPPAAKP